MPLLYYALTAIYCLFLFSLSASSELGTVAMPFNGADKVVHLVLYAGLGGIVSIGMRRSGKPFSPWSQCFIPIIFAALYGVSDEFHQYFVPNRTCEVGDVIADMAGACFAQIFLCYLWWRRPLTAAAQTEL